MSRLANIHHNQPSDPFASIERSWLDWACTLADPLVSPEVRDRVRTSAEQSATDRTTYYPWFTAAGRALPMLVAAINENEPWHRLAIDGPDAVRAYSWEQRLRDSGRLDPDEGTIDVFPHPNDELSAALITRLFARDRTDVDGWLAEADYPWPIVEEVFRTVLAVTIFHEDAIDLRWLMFSVAKFALGRQ